MNALTRRPRPALLFAGVVGGLLVVASARAFDPPQAGTDLVPDRARRRRLPGGTDAREVRGHVARRHPGRGMGATAPCTCRAIRQRGVASVLDRSASTGSCCRSAWPATICKSRRSIPTKHHRRGQRSTCAGSNRSERPVAEPLLPPVPQRLRGARRQHVALTERVFWAPSAPASRRRKASGVHRRQVRLAGGQACRRSSRCTLMRPEPENDRTVIRVNCSPSPLAPGRHGEVRPRVSRPASARCRAHPGYFQQYHLIAQWFPKVRRARANPASEGPPRRGGTATSSTSTASSTPTLGQLPRRAHRPEGLPRRARPEWSKGASRRRSARRSRTPSRRTTCTTSCGPPGNGYAKPLRGT